MTYRICRLNTALPSIVDYGEEFDDLSVAWAEFDRLRSEVEAAPVQPPHFVLLLVGGDIIHAVWASRIVNDNAVIKTLEPRS